MAPNVSIRDLLDSLFEREASDLILSAGAAPAFRVDGHLVPDSDHHLSGEDTDRLIRELLAPQQRIAFAEHHTVDFSFQWGERGRIRGNAFRQRGSVAVALRAIPTHIPSFSELLLPKAVGELARAPHGLVLCTGPTGSGKSTTQASLIDAINEEQARHIITIEDPIEYLHSNKRSVIEQREVGVDTPSFANALRSALREDPDVVLVGEMRDLESISMALTVAETGHLVLGTLHTNDAAQAVHRMVDVFPEGQQQQIRVQLGSALVAIVHQELLPRIGGGRVAAFEVLVATPAVKNLIRDNKIGQLRNVMATSSNVGMCTLEAALGWLVRAGMVRKADAIARSAYPNEVMSQAAPYLSTPIEEPEPAGDYRGLLRAATAAPVRHAEVTGVPSGPPPVLDNPGRQSDRARPRQR
ncbi:MAG: type IV pilus twitching motility protein PilT [Candidatus Dormibacteria bacterium]